MALGMNGYRYGDDDSDEYGGSVDGDGVDDDDDDDDDDDRRQ